MNRLFLVLGILFLFFMFSCAGMSANKTIESIKSKRDQIKINPNVEKQYGGIIRGAKDEKCLSLIFTGGSYGESGEYILDILKENDIKGSFFFTGEFLEKKEFAPFIKRLIKEGHYISIHSYGHLLYAPWENRSKTLVTKEEFTKDVIKNYKALAKFGVSPKDAIFWIPPYEYYNETIAKWSDELGLVLFNNSPGTLSAADYTQDADKNFRPNNLIFDSIVAKEKKDGLNGFLLLTHVGVASGRSEKFVQRLPEVIKYLKEQGYSFSRIDEILTVK